MSCRTSIALAIGTTLTIPYRYGVEPLVYKAITAKLTDAPLTLTVTGHGLPPTWPVALTDTAYDKLDASKWPPVQRDWLEGTATDADTVTLNDIDLTRLDGIWTNGTLAYMTPVNLAGASARLDVFAGNGSLAFSLVGTLDNAAKTIVFDFEDSDTADLVPGTCTFAAFFIDALDQETILDEGDLILYTPGSPPS